MNRANLTFLKVMFISMTDSTFDDCDRIHADVSNYQIFQYTSNCSTFDHKSKGFCHFSPKVHRYTRVWMQNDCGNIKLCIETTEIFGLNKAQDSYLQYQSVLFYSILIAIRLAKIIEIVLSQQVIHTLIMLAATWLTFALLPHFVFSMVLYVWCVSSLSEADLIPQVLKSLSCR